MDALRRDDPELGQVCPHCIREHCALTYEQLARAVFSADLTGTNRMVGRVTRPAERRPDGLRIVGLHIGYWDRFMVVGVAANGPLRRVGASTDPA